MADRESDSRTILENELIFGVRRRERMAWAVAIGGVLLGLGGVAVAGMVAVLGGGWVSASVRYIP